MKKTKATALTAAMLVAAANISACGSAKNVESENNVYAQGLDETVTETTTYDPESNTDLMYCVYGPPPTTEPPSSFEEYADATTTEYDPENDAEQFFPVYGPPPMPGDAYMDGVVDANDLARMRIDYNNGKNINDFDMNFYDVNNDGVFDLEDIAVLSRFLQGDIKNLSVPDEDDDDIVTTAPPTYEDTTYTTVATLYGPPPMYYDWSN